MVPKRFFLMILMLSLFAGCTRDKVVFQIGGFRVSARDITERDAINRVYFPEDKRDLGRQQLMRAYLQAQILKELGHPVTDAALSREAERIEKHTLMPQMLHRIQAIFKGDRRAYRRVYVLPTYVSRVLYYDIFLKDPKIQAGAMAPAEAFLKLAETHSPSFDSLAKERGYRVSRFNVSLSRGLSWNLGGHEGRAVAEAPPAPTRMPASIQKRWKDERLKDVSAEGKLWVQTLLAGLKPGQIVKTLVDQQEEWLVARYLGRSAKDPDQFRVEAVGFPKADFSAWLEAQSQHIKVTAFH